jgi:hypothetical protein
MHVPAPYREAGRWAKKVVIEFDGTHERGMKEGYRTKELERI